MVHMEAGQTEDDEGFSDVSSICDESDGTSKKILVNECRWLGRAKMKARAEAREAERRNALEAMKKAEEERKQRELEAMERRLEEQDRETPSEAGSALSDDSAEANESPSRCVEGPELNGAGNDSDDDRPGHAQESAKPTSSDFGSSDSEGEKDEDNEPSSPRVVTSNDDSTRIELQIQGNPDGSQGGAPRRVIVRLRSDWAPLGAARFIELVEAGFYNGTRFHRFVKGTLVQFGLPVDPALYESWKSRLLDDDSEGMKVSNSRGTVSFASRGENTRCCQVFVNLVHNKAFDNQGFTPFAEVVQGMEVVDEVFGGYGDLPPQGKGPDPDLIKEKGSEYLQEFPKLSWISSAEVLSLSGEFGQMPARTSLRDSNAPSPPNDTRSSRKISFSEDTSFVEKNLAEALPRAESPPAATPTVSRRPSSPAGSGLNAVKALRES